MTHSSTEHSKEYSQEAFDYTADVDYTRSRITPILTHEQFTL